MRGILKNFPDQLVQAKKLAEEVCSKVEVYPRLKWDAGDKPPRYLWTKDIRNIIICGMGGSAIGGDLLFDVLREELSIPIYVNRGYSPPTFLSQDSLVFISSYSGNTEETLFSYREAIKKTKNIFCITSNGTLEKEACLPNFPTVKIPGSLQPRAALGYLFTPMLVILSRIKLIQDKSSDIEECVNLLKELSISFDSEDSEPYKLAQALLNKMPIIYTDLSFQSIAKRWVAQLNENSKVFAHYNLFSELNHNEIVGFGVPAIENFVIILRDKQEHPQIKKRVEITKEIIGSYTSGIKDIWSQGKSLLARAFSLIYFGDWTSYWLAVLRKVDPVPVERIDYLKKRL